MIWGLDNRGCADIFKGFILFAVATLGLYSWSLPFKIYDLWSVSNTSIESVVNMYLLIIDKHTPSYWDLLIISGRCTDNEVLQCYKCSVTVEKYFINNTTIVTPLCSKFEETSSYMTNCPYSTMCLKTISTLHLQNGQKQETVTRGCAQQKNTTQVIWSLNDNIQM